MSKVKHSGWIAREGLPFIFVAFGFTILGWILHVIVFGLALTLLLFVLYFFRNPKRHVPVGPHWVVSPADGKILEVGEVKEERFLGKTLRRISIFMSPMDVHVNRIPVTGTVKQVAYNKGRFFPAYAEKSSLENEQNAVWMQTPKGESIIFVQIAGWLARRIVCYARPNEVWKQGDIFGMIRFGSRMDIYVPLDYPVQVRVGEKVRAGESILANIP